MNNNINNVNFQANMYLFGKYKGEKIWQEIAKEFEQKTAKYPTDVITIGNRKKSKEDMRIMHYAQGCGIDTYFDIKADNLKKILELPKNAIVEKFVKFTDIMSRYANRREDALQLPYYIDSNDRVSYRNLSDKIAYKIQKVEMEADDILRLFIFK